MGQPFDQWEQRIQDAADEDARRSLVAEVALWRARRLHDVVASRRATYALAQLHALLDDRGAAVREARSLLSLCQTPPVATGEELASAKAALVDLGETVPPMPGMERGRRRQDRDARGGGPRSEGRGRRGGSGTSSRSGSESKGGGRGRDAGRKPDVMAEARAAAAAGQVDRVHELARGRSGPTWSMLRVHADLTTIAALTDADERKTALARLHDAVGRSLSLPTGEATPEAGADPLSELLGQPAPRKRGPRLRAIERFADSYPDRIDELAAAALRHHLVVFGPGQPAPWLVGVVGRALARGEAPRTAAAVGELREAKAMAVLAYDEAPFQRIVPLVSAARAAGWTITSLRRGVLSRGEPADRKVWTLRVQRSDGPETMLAFAPDASDAYAEGKAEELAERMRSLCPRTLLVAPGAGNADLRAGIEALGLPAFVEDPGDEALLTAVTELSVEAPAAAPAQPTAPDRLVALLTEGEPTIEALTTILGEFRRPTKAFRVAERAEPSDAASAALLQAVPQVVDPEESLAEGVTLAMRVAAAGGAATREVLTGPLAERYGGAALQPVAELAEALVQDDWRVFRVLRGPTRRERQNHPVLETLAGDMQGLWRLLLRRGDVRGEVWYIHELSPEGRAGVPQLLLEDRQRVVALPVEPELLAWYRELGGPEPIGWTGSEAGSLREACASWAPTAQG